MAADAVGDDELADWLRLTEAPGVGPVAVRKLLEAFGLPDAVLGASREQLARVLSPTLADALRAAPSPALEALIARTRDWARDADNHVVTLADERYPRALLETADPPTLLYVKGRVDLLEGGLLAIVGSRNATAQGAIDARRFAEALASGGLTIVSGLALGIDAAAHDGALAAGAAGGSTIAVVGTGADLVYPATHRALAHRIADVGRDRVGAAARHGRERAPVPAPQPDHRGAVPRRARHRGGGAFRLADHRAARERGGPRRVRGAGLDPFAAVEGLPSADPAGREARRFGRRHPRRMARREAPATRRHRRPRRATDDALDGRARLRPGHARRARRTRRPAPRRASRPSAARPRTRRARRTAARRTRSGVSRRDAVGHARRRARPSTCTDSASGLH